MTDERPQTDWIAPLLLIARAVPAALFVFALATGSLGGIALAALGIVAAVLVVAFPYLQPMSDVETEEEAPRAAGPVTPVAPLRRCLGC